MKHDSIVEQDKGGVVPSRHGLHPLQTGLTGNQTGLSGLQAGRYQVSQSPNLPPLSQGNTLLGSVATPSLQQQGAAVSGGVVSPVGLSFTGKASSSLRLRKSGRPRKRTPRAIADTPTELMEATPGTRKAVGRSRARARGKRGRGGGGGGRGKGKHRESTAGENESDPVNNLSSARAVLENDSTAIAVDRVSNSEETPPLSSSLSIDPPSLPPDNARSLASICDLSSSLTSDLEDPLVGLSASQKRMREAEKIGRGSKVMAEEPVNSDSKTASRPSVVPADGKEVVIVTSTAGGKEVAMVTATTSGKEVVMVTATPDGRSKGNRDGETEMEVTLSPVGGSATVVAGVTEISPITGLTEISPITGVTEISPITIDDSCPVGVSSEVNLPNQEATEESGVEVVASGGVALPTTDEIASGVMNGTLSDQVLDDKPHPIAAEHEAEKATTLATPPLPSSSVPHTPTDAPAVENDGAMSSPRPTPMGILKHISQFDTPSSASKVGGGIGWREEWGGGGVGLREGLGGGGVGWGEGL